MKKAELIKNLTKKKARTSHKRSIALTIGIVVVLVASSFLILVQRTSANPYTWQISQVDNGGDDGQYTSLALDSSNNPHISYYRSTAGGGPGDLRYAYWNGTAWNTTNVDTAGQVGTFTSIAIDSNDRPHISYRHVTNGDLKYAYWNGTNWTIQTVDGQAGDNVGQYTSLKLDGNGYPHISYYNITGGDLKYAYWNGTNWTIQTVDGQAGDNVGQWTSLELDMNYYPHISYYNGTGTSLKYAYWNGTAWTIQTVDGAGSDTIGQYTSLELTMDKIGNLTVIIPHISYYNGTGTSLKYAYWNGTAWTIQTVDGAGSDNVGQFTSLKLTYLGVHISYYNTTGTSLKYAENTNGTWVIETVDGAGADNVGQYNSLAIGSDDYIQIAYYDASGGAGGTRLKFAESNQPIPEFSVILIPILATISLFVMLRKKVS